MQREVKCQVCTWHGQRYFGSGLLVKPCPECGSRTTFATWQAGDMAVTVDPRLSSRQEPKGKAPNVIPMTIEAWHSVGDVANGI